MPVTTTIHLNGGPGGADEDVVCTLTDEDVALFTAFLSYVTDLEALSIVQSPPSLSLNFRVESGASVFSASLPPWETVMPLLHRLRPIILENEHASYATVAARLGQRVPSPAFRALLRFSRQIYDGRHQQEMIRVSANETVLNSERVLMNWLNAYEYHRDQSLKAQIDRLLGWLPEDLPRFFFVQMLFDKVRAAQALAGMAELALGRRTTFTARIPLAPPAV